MHTIAAALFVLLSLASPLRVSVVEQQPLIVLQEPPTPTPTPSPTPTPFPYRWELVEEQATRYDYIITTGDVMIAALLVMLVVSVWVLAFVYFIVGGRRV